MTEFHLARSRSRLTRSSWKRIYISCNEKITEYILLRDYRQDSGYGACLALPGAEELAFLSALTVGPIRGNFAKSEKS